MKTNSLLFAFECTDYTFSSDAQTFCFLFLKRSTFICIFLNSYYIVSWAKMARDDDDAEEMYESKHYFIRISYKIHQNRRRLPFLLKEMYQHISSMVGLN